VTDRGAKINTPSGPKGTFGTQPEILRVRLLGGFSVSVGSRTIQQNAWSLRKAAALVKVLALAPRHRLHREQVVDALWPDSGKKAASNSLRKTLHAARRTLDPVEGSRYLASENDSLVLCSGSSIWVDVEAFEEAATTARLGQDPAAYRAALDLYAGDLLPEDRYEEWAEERRQELRGMFLSLLIELATVHEERGEYRQGVEALRRAVAEEPTLEEAHAGLMRLYVLLGQEGEALAQYERLKETLSKQLGTKPSTATEHLRDEIVSGEFPSALSSPTRPPQAEEPLYSSRHNLPAPRTSFIGREREMLKVKRALAMTRLLTLTGAGGSGKTRLALEVAGNLVGAYPDGMWLVELAGLSEGELVPQAVAGVLGVQEQRGRPLTDTLVETLRVKRILLVLDNCEHLIDATAHLADALLSSCPHLRVLATSREALGVEGELLWRVPPLCVPEADRAPAAPKELTRYGAVRLFVERARLRSPEFELSSENAGAVAQICRTLEGIPLALELAAARVEALSVEQISQRLKDSLKLLTGGSRTATPRHRTLRGTLNWSHELLPQDERVLFRRLSAFAGGWTLEAAETVGAGGGIEEEDVLELLSNLMDKSLVVTEVKAAHVVRYRMLEPVRQYARERLEESGEVEAIQRRHAEFFLVLAEEAEPAVEGAQQAAWLERLETEHDNFRAALSWSLERVEDAELGLRVGAALGEFWYLRGYFGEGRRWLEEALARSGQASTVARANALRRDSFLAFVQGDLDRAIEASEEGLKLEGVELFWGAGGRTNVAADLLNTLGMAVSARGDSERAIQLYEESLALSRKVGDERSVAINLMSLGAQVRSRGDFEKATELLEEGLVLSRELGEPAVLASFLTLLGYTFVLQGDLERATAVGEEAAAILREQKHRLVLADALSNLGWAALLRGDSERATTLHAESLEITRELSDNLVRPETLEGLACAAVAKGEAERAVRLFGATRALNAPVSYHPTPRERAALREPYLAATRSHLSEETWEAAFAEGQAMGFEEAVEYALSRGEIAAPTAPAAPEKSPVGMPSTILTRREEEVAFLVAQGLTNRQIASELSISEHTVATHIAKIMKKLALRSRAQITAWVTEQRMPSSGLG
jgi:predicted ATPase/DNA-binding SARP family transcriptional activator/DNA-binding CsgD family transcriptional regulator